jgi:hypothetical protein
MNVVGILLENLERGARRRSNDQFESMEVVFTKAVKDSMFLNLSVEI